MSKVAKALRALWWILRNPVLLNRVLEDEDTWEKHVKEKYPFRQGLPLVRMDQVLKADTFSIGPMTFLDGGSLPTDLMLLAGLAEGIKDCRYFEFGTWRGESVTMLSSRTRSCHTLCLTDEEMRHMGMPEKVIEQHRLFSADLENVTQLRGNSKTFDFASLNNKFDLVFIDGDHHYEGVLSDTRNTFEHLVHENSIVVWHDYGYHPDKIRYEVMAAILDGAGPERTGKIYHVAHTKTAIYMGQSLESSEADFPCIPGEYYSLELARKML